MSCYIVNDETITAIVMGAMEYLDSDYWGRRIDPHKFGQMLVEENYRSWDARYGSNSKPHKFEWKELKRWDMGICLGCINCYEYQSCETDDWRNTEAYIMLQRLKRAMLEKLIELKGYEIPWGYED